MLLPIQKLDEHGLRLAFEALNRCLEKMTHTPYEAAPWALSGDATFRRPVITTARDVSSVQFPDTANPGVISGTWRLPPLWVSGKVGMAILHTGSAASTNAIAFAWTLSRGVLGFALPSPAPATFTTPGPAVAGALLKVSVPTETFMDASAEKACWTLARTNGDAYAGDVYIIGIEPLWYAGRQ